MRRSKWMTFFVIASFFIAVPGYGLKLKIATLYPEGSVWMDKMQAGAELRVAGMEVTQKLLETGQISRQALEQLDSLLKASGS